MLEPENNNKKDVKFFHVNGTMSSGVRNWIMKEFKESEIGIMSNARCLTEGVDVPAVDTVAFIDPKRSLIDIVQATGRAMRKAEWKEKGYIFIPVVVEEDTDPEKFIESSDFDTVWQVLQAMVDQDQRLEDIVSQLRIMQGKGEEGTQAWKDAMTDYTERIEFYNLPKTIDKIRFINTLYTKTVEVAGKKWDFWYGLTLAYKEQFGDPNAPRGYKTPEGYKLSLWQTNQRQRKNKLSSEQIRKLDEIGFTWELREEYFEKGFRETLKYKEQFGDANAPTDYKTAQGFKLGQWQTVQRQIYKKGRLPPNRIKRFEEIGFKWKLIDETFEKGFQETIKYKEQFGSPNAPVSYKTHAGYNLGSWQDTQRQFFKKGNLSSDRVQRLEEMGFIWDTLDEMFEKGFLETVKYKEQYGNANALVDYKTPQGYKLGSWQHRQRQLYKKGKLLSDRIERLSKIGFILNRNLTEEAFENGFQETIRFKEQYGIANVPRNYETPEGYKLGRWQHNQRGRKHRLSSDKIQKLEEIGFNFDLKRSHSESFDKGFQETIKYKELYGDANVRWGYKTPDGFNLYQWQSHQRRKKNKLSAVEIKMLEEIGFQWDINFIDERFGKGFKETIRYKEQHGDPNARSSYKTPEGYQLGGWQSKQRQAYKKGTLSPDRVKRLEEIGLRLDDIQTKLPPDESFEKGFMETAKYKEQYGNANVPQGYKTPQGYKLRQWQGCQRYSYKKGKLDREKIRKLEDVGFVWDLKEESFNKGLQETIKHKEQFGDSNAHQSCVTTEGFNLGSWQNTKRQSYKMGKLSVERIRRLEEVGFKWNFNTEDKSFEKGFNETLKYKEQFGDANARISHKTSEEYPLGRWQSKRRQAYKNGKLSKEKIKRFEEIGFIFKPHDESFEKGFEETLRYKKQFGDVNAPDAYKTPEGYSLGKWQGKKRQAYKKGNLSPERIKRLEEIGFKWQLDNKRK